MTLNWFECLFVAIMVGSFAAMCLASPAQGAPVIPVGEGLFEFASDTDRPEHKLRVWTYRPEGLDANSPIVFVLHGQGRDARDYRNTWLSHSRAGGFLLLAPQFPEATYPEAAYQHGNVCDHAGEPNPPERWTFNVIEKLFDHIRALTGSRVERYHLYGHSAGGQFVHRFVLFMPDARYARAIAANPGYYTFPTRDAAYPFGLKGTLLTAPPFDPLARDFVLMLGVEDTRRDTPNFPKTPQADAQGLTRFERGQNYFQAMAQVAETAGAPLHWRLVTVPGVGHSNKQMVPSAARELFAKQPSMQ